MDSSQKRVGIIAEVTRGTTPATPAWLKLREMGVEMSPDRPWTRSPERSANRRVYSTYRGLNSNSGRIQTPFVYDVGLQLLISSMMQAPWSTNVLKDGSTLQPFSMEEFFENGTNDIYKRNTGVCVTGAALSIPEDGPATWRFDTTALAETALDTAIIASATYVEPSVDDPFTAADCVLSTFWGLTVPKITKLDLNIVQNPRNQYQWGSRDPFGTGLGQVSFNGSIDIYWSSATEYTTFVDGELGDLIFTVGPTAGQKTKFEFLNVRGYQPKLPDAVNNGDQMCTITFEAHHDVTDNSALKITRAI